MGESRRDVNIYQACNSCGGTGLLSAVNQFGVRVAVPCGCRLVRVIETGLTVGQVDRLVMAERNRLGDPEARRGPDPC